MTKKQVHVRGGRLEALPKGAGVSDERVAERLCHAIRQTSQDATGPVAVWDGEPAATAADHDRIYDER